MIVNFLIFVFALAMIAGVALFVSRYNRKTPAVPDDDEDVLVDQGCCGSNCCDHENKAETFDSNTGYRPSPVSNKMLTPVVEQEKPIMITMKTLDRVKGKTKQWLLDQGLTKAQADEILADITKPFDVTGMDLLTAPFEYNNKQ